MQIYKFINNTNIFPLICIINIIRILASILLTYNVPGFPKILLLRKLALVDLFFLFN
ncbi:MAG: hypothetical protein UV58_C0012G0022 [Candidatus Wolfebacteria bacterium GW2011_GWC1_43_10]|uniref:Uncharacterized protein n=1 Tax=Candidatus Wolfebacteria bacterium GW2011_GWC1_43_10 TaxID=1619011 RepID=A0A0G1EGK9_9BACT|nr:MAG: hypothetical protein UV58_C0012G0022 [Candidatus Wolfebacteria bacterium GW2011_GWC1_43_10]